MWLGLIPLIQEYTSKQEYGCKQEYSSKQKYRSNNYFTLSYCLLGHQICRTLVKWWKSQKIQLSYAAGGDSGDDGGESGKEGGDSGDDGGDSGNYGGDDGGNDGGVIGPRAVLVVGKVVLMVW